MSQFSLLSALKMEIAGSSETILPIYQTTRRQMSEESNLR
jgi:hypothetical protein